MEKERRSQSSDRSRLYNRILWIVYDDVHASAVRVPIAKEIARQMIRDWIGPDDLIGVRRVAGDADHETVLAADIARAQAAIDGFASRRRPRLSDEEEVNRVSDVMDTLSAIGGAMRSMSGRRIAILMISEGIEYDVFNGRSAGATRVRESSEAAIQVLRQANVVLYAIDPRGLVSTEGEGIERGAAGRETFAVESALADADARLSRSRLSLRHMAEETGGFASINSNRFESAIDRIGREISDYYLLGFVPRDLRCERGMRRIQVKAMLPQLRVRSRTSYSCKTTLEER
jgi:VWFA-related protein